MAERRRSALLMESLQEITQQAGALLDSATFSQRFGTVARIYSVPTLRLPDIGFPVTVIDTHTAAEKQRFSREQDVKTKSEPQSS